MRITHGSRFSPGSLHDCHTVTASADAPLLDTSRAAFLLEPVAINVASRDSGFVPSIARAFGCRISADRRLVTLFLSAARSRVLLRDLRAGAPIAAVFARPINHRSLQLKAPAAEIQPLAPGDEERMAAYADAFAAELAGLGESRIFSQAMVMAVSDEAIAVTFAPTGMFEQTPGPAAGQRLEPGT